MPRSGESASCFPEPTATFGAPLSLPLSPLRASHLAGPPLNLYPVQTMVATLLAEKALDKRPCLSSLEVFLGSHTTT